MKTEIKPAVCPICDEIFNDNRCWVCQMGHKFHNFFYDYQDIETTKCPKCRNENIELCKGNYNDIFSGGKTKNKREKPKKNQKTKKTKKRYKKFYEDIQ